VTRFSVAQQTRPEGQSAALAQMALPTDDPALPLLEAAPAPGDIIVLLEAPYEVPPLLDDPRIPPPLAPALASSEAGAGAPPSSP
jgi:hypothetical protein